MGLKNILKQSLTCIFSEKVILFKTKNTGKVILSFDDGPQPEFTEKVLDTLKEHDVKAQFFLIGNRLQDHPEIVKRIVAEGHAIGSHSYSHKGFGRLPWSEQKRELVKGVDAVRNFDPQAKWLFRPPQGKLNLSQILYCRRKNITIVMWTVDSLDYNRSKTKEDILNRLKNISWAGGEIVLFHDDNSVTVDVLPEFIRWIKSKGLEFGI